MSPRSKFILIFLMFSVPFVGSTLVFIFWKPTATNNYGELLSPVTTLPETKLNFINMGEADKDVAGHALRGKWLMLTRDSGHCEVACRKKLYAMRQARLILGRELDRVLRVVLVDDGVMPSDELQKEFAGTVWISANEAPWLVLLPKSKSESVNSSVSASGKANHGRDQIFGVDTIGNIFIRYSADPDIKRMSGDFQRVLKASQIG